MRSQWLPCLVLALVMSFGSEIARAQSFNPFEIAAQMQRQCMTELGLTAPLEAAQIAELNACVLRKQEASRPKTAAERQKRAEELREGMMKDDRENQARRKQAEAIENARMEEVRAGAFGPQMQRAVLCRESLQQQGLQPQAPRWIEAILLCVQKTPARPPVAGLPAPGTDAWCALETRRQNIRNGIPDGTVLYKDPNTKADTNEARLCATLSGRDGVDLQVSALCAGELQDLFIMSRVQSTQEVDPHFERCERRLLREFRAQSGRSAPMPFGDDSRVSDYLNALYNDDLERLRGMDRLLTNRYSFGINVTLMTPILQNYFAMYPSRYSRCLESDAPSITVGESYDDVTKDGTGLEIRRTRVDTRREVPVNRRFYDMARTSGIGQGSRLDDVVTGWGGVNLRDLGSAQVNQVVRDVMTAYACDSPAIRRLEEKFIRYAPVLAAR
jgi:hypothetical protein